MYFTTLHGIYIPGRDINPGCEYISVIYSHNPARVVPPQLVTGNNNIPYAAFSKFLGTIWDAKLTLKEYINSAESAQR